MVLTRESGLEKKLTIRASSQDEFNKWQFALHKTVAVLFPKLLESRKSRLLELELQEGSTSASAYPALGVGIPGSAGAGVGPSPGTNAGGLGSAASSYSSTSIPLPISARGGSHGDSSLMGMNSGSMGAGMGMGMSVGGGGGGALYSQPPPTSHSYLGGSGSFGGAVIERSRSTNSERASIRMSNLLMGGSLALDEDIVAGTGTGTGVGTGAGAVPVRSGGGIGAGFANMNAVPVESPPSGGSAGRAGGLSGLMLNTRIEGGGELASMNTMDHVSRSLQYTTRRFRAPGAGPIGGTFSQPDSGDSGTKTHGMNSATGVEAVGGADGSSHTKKFSFEPTEEGIRTLGRVEGLGGIDPDPESLPVGSHRSDSERSFEQSRMNSLEHSAASSFAGIPIAGQGVGLGAVAGTGSLSRPSALTAAMNVQSGSMPKQQPLSQAQPHHYPAGAMAIPVAAAMPARSRMRSDSSDSGRNSMHNNPFKDTGPISADDLLLDYVEDDLEASMESLDLDQSQGDEHRLGHGQGQGQGLGEGGIGGGSGGALRAAGDDELFDFDEASSHSVGALMGQRPAPAAVPRVQPLGGLSLAFGAAARTDEAPVTGGGGTSGLSGLSAALGAASVGPGVGVGVGVGSGSVDASVHAFGNSGGVSGGSGAGGGGGQAIPTSLGRLSGSVHKGAGTGSGLMNSLGKMNLYMGVPNATALQWKVGACSLRGKRSANEDRYVVITDFREEVSAVPDSSSASWIQRTKHMRAQDLPEKIPCGVNMSAGGHARSCSSDSVGDDGDISGTPTRAARYIHHNNSSGSGSNSGGGGSNSVGGGGGGGSTAGGAAAVDREAFFAVYDGHCGDTASIHCANHLHLAIAR